ncbi:MAG: hypothetical protein IAE80_07820 [Anaerolinea sp.]|nr:hypothetical protein [Anaerolinea sp.]
MQRSQTQKPGNGEGQGGAISLVFDLSDPLEREAYEMAKQLARPHGRRKHVIVALLYGLSMYQRRTGIELNTDLVMGMAVSGNLIGGGGLDISATSRPMTLDEPTVVIATAEKGTKEEFAANFFSSFGNFLD